MAINCFNTSHWFILVYLVTPARNTQIWVQICHSVDGPLMSWFILHHVTVKGVISLLSLRCPKHKYFNESQYYYNTNITSKNKLSVLMFFIRTDYCNSRQ